MSSPRNPDDEDVYVERDRFGQYWLVDTTDGYVDEHGVLHYERTRIEKP